MLTYEHTATGVAFSWDGWMRILVTPNARVPSRALPERFDIREPDLLDPARNTVLPHNNAVHLLPETQPVFERLCEDWLAGHELCVGVRDYAADPWHTRSWGITRGTLQFRYTGGEHIDIAPADTAATGTATWRPMISLASDGRDPRSLSTRWLMDRIDGWELAWLAAHGVLDAEDPDPDEATIRWARTHLPAPSRRGSIGGQLELWCTAAAAADFTAGRWAWYRDLGTATERTSRERPVIITLTAPGGQRSAFGYCGGPYSLVWSPDRTLRHPEHFFARHPPQQHPDAVRAWLHGQATAWLAELTTTGRIPTPIPLP